MLCFTFEGGRVRERPVSALPKIIEREFGNDSFFWFQRCSRVDVKPRW